MRYLVTVIILISFIGCKAKKPWTKDNVVNDCLHEFNKRNEAEKKFTGMQIPLICDCMSDKLVATYKSDEESSKDKEGVMKLTKDCAMEVMNK